MTTATASARQRVAHPVSGLRLWPVRRPAWEILGIGAIVLFVVWTASGLLFMHFLDDGPVGDLDRSIAEWFEDRRTPTINSMTSFGSMLSDTVVKVALIVVVGGTMTLVWRRWHDGVFLALAVLMEATVFLFVSLVVDRDRPPVEQVDTIPPSGSFPSGHTAACVAFYGGVAVVVSWHTCRRWVRAGFVALAVVTTVIVAVSRVARGMHHPIDVIAGALLGLASLIVVQRALVAGVRRIDAEAVAGRAVPDHVRRLDLTGEAPPAIERFDAPPAVPSLEEVHR
jgi:undecaprenyl-diphosphatase